MNSRRLIIMFVLLLFIVLFAGCGRKTPPVFSDKGVVNISEEGKNQE